jgi:hypothetical protein
VVRPAPDRLRGKVLAAGRQLSGLFSKNGLSADLSSLSDYGLTRSMPDPNPIDDVEIFGAKGDACLQVGDTIALCLQREGKFFCVGSEGFVDLGTSLREVAFESTIPWTFIDCQWVVTNKFQYDAQKKLRRHLKAQRRAKAEVAGAEGVPQHKDSTRKQRSRQQRSRQSKERCSARSRRSGRAGTGASNR